MWERFVNHLKDKRFAIEEAKDALAEHIRQEITRCKDATEIQAVLRFLEVPELIALNRTIIAGKTNNIKLADPRLTWSLVQELISRQLNS